MTRGGSYLPLKSSIMHFMSLMLDITTCRLNNYTSHFTLPSSLNFHEINPRRQAVARPQRRHPDLLLPVLPNRLEAILGQKMKNRLKVLRAERNWSQAELADRLDVSRQTVNAVETGKYDPSLPLAFKVARLFGRSFESIFEPAEDFAQGDGAP